MLVADRVEWQHVNAATIKAIQRYFQSTQYKPDPKKLGAYAKTLRVNITHTSYRTQHDIRFRKIIQSKISSYRKRKKS